MPGDHAAGHVAAHVAEIVSLVDARRARCGSTHLVAIDGPSGAGKTTLAAEVAAALAAPTVHMDDLYPGWDGLMAASGALAADLLEPLAATGRGRWRRWDWAKERPAEWHEVSAPGALIVEGCGTLAAANVRRAHLALWLDADDTLRKTRALDRDGAGFASHWDQWQSEFEEYLAREHPRARADLVLDVTDWPIGSPPRRAPGATVVP
jgi:cytidylate kinase